MPMPGGGAGGGGGAVGVGRGRVLVAMRSAYAQRERENHDLNPERERGVPEPGSALLDLRPVGGVERLQPVRELPMDFGRVLGVLVEGFVDLRPIEREDQRR